MVIQVQFHASAQRFKTSFSASDQAFTPVFDALHEVTIHKDADPYRGAYEVTPQVDEQVLPTAQKLMVDDLTVKAIPRYDVSNNSGGQTVYIAREV